MFLLSILLAFATLSWYHYSQTKTEGDEDTMPDSRVSKRVTELLKEHKTDLILEMGSAAFDLMTPQETAKYIGLDATKRIPELIRQGWLEPAEGKDIGTAHQYHRWRVEFVKRHKKVRKNSPE